MSSESCHCPTKEDRKLGFVERDVQLHFKFTFGRGMAEQKTLKQQAYDMAVERLGPPGRLEIANLTMKIFRLMSPKPLWAGIKEDRKTEW